VAARRRPAGSCPRPLRPVPPQRLKRQRPAGIHVPGSSDGSTWDPGLRGPALPALASRETRPGNRGSTT
jgi:hypothetical protein